MNLYLPRKMTPELCRRTEQRFLADLARLDRLPITVPRAAYRERLLVSLAEVRLRAAVGSSVAAWDCLYCGAHQQTTLACRYCRTMQGWGLPPVDDRAMVAA